MGSGDRSGCGDRAPELRTARVAVTTVFFANGALNASWAPYIPHIKSDLELSARGLGVVLLAMAFGAVAVDAGRGHPGRALRRAPDAGRGRRARLCRRCRSCCSRRRPLALAGVLVALGASTGVTDVAMNANGAAVEHRYGRPILSSLHAFWSIGAFAGGGRRRAHDRDRRPGGAAPRGASPSCSARSACSPARA